jgi:hypothetical protein
MVPSTRHTDAHDDAVRVTGQRFGGDPIHERFGLPVGGGAD